MSDEAQRGGSSRRPTVTHHSDAAKSGASWSDLVQFIEIDDDFRVRHGMARVTSEFMRDASDAVATVGRILDGVTSS